VPDTGDEVLLDPPQPLIPTTRSAPAVASSVDALRVTGLFVWRVVISGHTFPSPSLGPPLLSASRSPALCCGIPLLTWWDR
jgi:hypothetical protein